MKKIILLLISLIYANIIFAQNNLSETKKLATTVKVWGFLKYYHPSVAVGKYNWDEELLKILSRVENCGNTEQLSQVYLDWINSLGTIKKCTKCDKKDNIKYFYKNFDLSWTENSKYFNEELSSKLKYIEENRSQRKNYYVRESAGGNIEVKNEPEYLDKDYPDRNHRLLSLSKYWNTIEYFFPYKYLTDQNWDSVLLEMIPKFLDAQNKMEYHWAMLETVIKLDDSHAGFNTKILVEEYHGNKYLPIDIGIVEGKVVITGFRDVSFSKKNDLRIGDIIETIDSENALERIYRIIKYVNGSNTTVKVRNSKYAFFNGFNDKVSIYIKRGDELIGKELIRFNYTKDSSKIDNIEDETYTILDNNIGYINMGILKENDIKEMMKSLILTNGLIIDLRNYPRIKPYALGAYFIKTKKEFAKFIQPDLSYPGMFIWKRKKIIEPNGKKYYNGKVILLVNEKSQSQSEHTAMLLQTADDVLTIGSQTAGANGNISKFEFLGYWAFASGLGVYYPDGSQMQRTGVKIDVEVITTIKGLQEGKDEVLEKAIELINN